MSVVRPINSPFTARASVVSATLAGGTPTADANLTLAITKPDGTLVNVPNGSLTAMTTGVYWYTYTPDQAGLYVFVWDGTYGGHVETVEVVDIPAST